MSSFDPVDALLVVDVQRAFVTGPEAVSDGARLLAVVTDLVERARAVGLPVLQLQNDGRPGAVDEPGSPGWELALPPAEGEPVIRKTEDDGFVGTDLAARLVGVRTLVVAGVQSEMCVAATARGAQSRGMTVVLPRDAHATYDVPEHGPHAPSVPAALVSRVAEWSLGDEVVLVDRAADVSLG